MVKGKALTRMLLVIYLVILPAAAAQGAQTTPLIGNDSVPLDGRGTEQQPYRYLIDEHSRVAWKHLLENREQKITEVYECRADDAIGGDLRYRYTFRAQDISPNVSGPYFLGIRIYDREAVEGLPGYPGAMFFSFVTKRDFPGSTEVTLNVSGKFADGTKLDLTYYGGYDSTVIHGAAPGAAKDEIRQVDASVVQIAEELTVSGGLVTFDIRYGGNYLLHTEPVDFSDFGVDEVIHYDADKVLGSIRKVFPTAALAEAIAAQLGKKTGDSITQGEIDSIKSLYLASVGLESTEELERVHFSRLESLTLAENELESLDSLAMPALTYLDAGGNRLKSVNALARLDALENVNLSENELTSLPDLNRLVHLQTLDLSDNQLEIIPVLASGGLRYLDLSGNGITRMAGDLEKCPSLEKMVLTGQVFDTAAQIDPGENFKLQPEPRFISQFGNGGTVTVIDSRGRAVYEGDFSALEADEFCLSGALFEKPGAYTVTVTGTVLQDGSEQNLGRYTYTLTAGDGIAPGLDARQAAACAVIVILLGIGVGLGLHARRQKKRNEENQ